MVDHLATLATSSAVSLMIGEVNCMMLAPVSTKVKIVGLPSNAEPSKSSFSV